MEKENKAKPKKVLKVQDLIFILPDNFEGDIQNALMTLAEYLNIHIDDDDVTKFGNNAVRELSGDSDSHRVSMEYGIFQLDDDGNYRLI